MKKLLTSAGFLLVAALLSIGGCLRDDTPAASTSTASLSNASMPGPATSGNSSNTTAVNPGNETISSPGTETEPPPATGEPSSTGSTPFNPGSGNITPGIPNQNSTENPGSGGITPSVPGGNTTPEGTESGSST